MPRFACYRLLRQLLLGGGRQLGLRAEPESKIWVQFGQVQVRTLPCVVLASRCHVNCNSSYQKIALYNIWILFSMTILLSIVEAVAL